MKITLTLCLALLFFSCKKDLPPKNEATTNEGNTTLPRATGYLPLNGEAYLKLVNYKKLRENNAIPICSSVDLTAQFPTPCNQGIQGSCVAWVTAYATKSYLEKKEHNWLLSFNNHLFSPQYIYSQTHLSNEAGGGGSYFFDALNLINNKGVTTLDVTPYDPLNLYGFLKEPTANMHLLAFPFRNNSWSALPYRDVQAIKNNIYNKEPVMIGIPVYADLDNLNSGNDTYDNLTGVARGAHAVTIIGYDDVRQSFKFINQWGTEWGLDGYGWMSYDLVSNNDFEAYVMFDKPDPLFAAKSLSTSAVGVSATQYFSGDFNGDGNTDVLQPFNNNGKLSIIAHNISTPNSNLLCNQTFAGISFTNVGFIAVDMNGDGKTDLVQASRNGNALKLSSFLSNGNSFTNNWNETTSAGYESLKFLPVDMDGDGKTDIAQLSNKNGKLALIVFKSTGTSYTQAFTTTLNMVSVNVDFVAADYNGDGKTDILRCWNNAGNLSVSVIKSTGSSYYNSWNGTLPQSAANVGFVPVDYNEDGNMDFVQGWNDYGILNLFLYKSTGSGYSFVSNSETQNQPANLGLIAIKKNGETETGFIQVQNNNANINFIKYCLGIYN